MTKGLVKEKVDTHLKKLYTGVMSRWKETDAYQLPARPGVYAMYRDGHIVYIGQSVNIATRFVGHRLSTIPKNNCKPHEIRVKYKLSNKMGEWLSQEYRLIGRLKPVWNKAIDGWEETRALLKNEWMMNVGGSVCKIYGTDSYHEGGLKMIETMSKRGFPWAVISSCLNKKKVPHPKSQRWTPHMVRMIASKRGWNKRTVVHLENCFEA